MRKVLLSASCCFLLGAAAFAQKQTAGNFTAEVSILRNGINFNVSALNSAIGGAKLRYFFADDLAIRLGLNVTSASNKFEATENADGTGGVGTGKATSSNIVIAPGIEKHFGNWGKVSPYVGFDLTAGFRAAREERDQLVFDPFAFDIEDAPFFPDSKLTIENAHTFGSGNDTFNRIAEGGTSFGFNLVTGVDFYVTEGLFLGAEMGLGFTSFSAKDIIVTAEFGNNTGKFVFQRPKSSGFDPNIVGGLRLGWNFGTGSGSPRNR